MRHSLAALLMMALMAAFTVVNTALSEAKASSSGESVASCVQSLLQYQVTSVASAMISNDSSLPEVAKGATFPRAEATAKEACETANPYVLQAGKEEMALREKVRERRSSRVCVCFLNPSHRSSKSAALSCRGDCQRQSKPFSPLH